MSTITINKLFSSAIQYCHKREMFCKFFWYDYSANKPLCLRTPHVDIARNYCRYRPYAPIDHVSKKKGSDK